MKNNYYVVFHSVTIATNVKRLLDKRGVTSVMMHTPKSIQLNGCSYSLQVKEHHYHQVIDCAEAVGAEVMGVFKAEDKGFVEVDP